MNINLPSFIFRTLSNVFHFVLSTSNSQNRASEKDQLLAHKSLFCFCSMWLVSLMKIVFTFTLGLFQPIPPAILDVHVRDFFGSITLAKFGHKQADQVSFILSILVLNYSLHTSNSILQWIRLPTLLGILAFHLGPMKAYSVLLVIHQLSHTLETMIPLLLLHFNDPVEVTADVTLELKLECIVATFSLFPSIWYSSEIEEVVTVQRTETEKAISDMKMKKNFLRKELRTPFASVLGYLELLDLDETFKKHKRSKEYISNAIQSCSHLVSMLNSVLSLEKLEAQNEPTFTHLQIEKIFQSVWAVAAGFFSQSKLDFSMVIKKGVPEMINGNELFLRQILINLIHNSTKFTTNGSICVTAHLKPRTKLMNSVQYKATHFVVFKVKDTGSGIPSSSLAHLFQPFVQASRDDRGTGLGLNFVRQFAEAMGGFAFAKSEGVGLGSSFYVCIPHTVDCVSFQKDTVIGKISPVDRTTLSPFSSTENLFKQATQPQAERYSTVLFAEDNLMTQRVMVLMLHKLGLKVQLATDGRQAQEMYMKSPEMFFCILLDYEMPNQSGVETAKNIRKKNPNIPIAVLTAHSTEKDKEECLECGANFFLTKPISIQTLRDLFEDIKKFPLGDHNSKSE